jgi:tRNA threonylcarbamoyladenosine modification (KEOPS) complex Cgi121 subunit
MEFVVLSNTGAMVASSIEVTLNDNDEHVVYAREIYTGTSCAVKNFGSDETTARRIRREIHTRITDRFSNYIVSVQSSPILIDLR